MNIKISKTLNEQEKIAEFFDQSVQRRLNENIIPEQADIRRASGISTDGDNNEPIDPRMSEILFGNHRLKYINFVSHKNGGRVLELCCGPGWLALELGRRGQIVDAYDISPEAIACARRMLVENPFKEGFGEVNYYLKDVTEVDLDKEKYDAISCWASWYYLSDFEELLDSVCGTLRPGGIFAIEDDRSPRTLEYFN